MDGRSLEDAPTMALILMLLDCWGFDLDEEPGDYSKDDVIDQLKTRSGQNHGQNYFKWVKWFLESNHGNEHLDKKYIVQSLKTRILEAEALVKECEKIIQE